MSEQTIFDRVKEPVRIDRSRVRELRPRDVFIRFIFGAVTSAVAAILSIAFGARAGGIMLAFPAILAASLTLIANADGMKDAREDARGASAGALALGGFALVTATLFGQLPGAAVLAVAAVAWTLVAIAIYYLAWAPRP